MNITAYMLSCPEREAMREETLARLRATDWTESIRVEVDGKTAGRREERQEQTALKMLQRAVGEAPGFILFLEDDLQFNRYLLHNLRHWLPLLRVQPTEPFFGSLYNPNIRELERHPEQAFFIADPLAVYGSQAFVLSQATTKHALAHWGETVGMQDIKLSRLAARVSPIYYHVPSLVQHVGFNSVWGGHYHSARDFHPDWKCQAENEGGLNEVVQRGHFDLSTQIKT